MQDAKDVDFVEVSIYAIYGDERGHRHDEFAR